jgi:hypothetical protein
LQNKRNPYLCNPNEKQGSEERKERREEGAEKRRKIAR